MECSHITSVDGEMSDIPVEQFVFTEETTVVFAVAFGPNLESAGTICVKKDNTAGLTAMTIASVVLTDGYGPTGANAEKRAFVNGQTPEVLKEGVPEGYKTLNKFEWYKDSTSMWKIGGNPFYRSCYSQVDISQFNVVTFMMKVETQGDAKFEFANGKVVRNEWLSFELVKVEDNVWSLLVTNEAGEIVYSNAAITRITNGLTDVDSVASLVFPISWNGNVKTQAVLLQPATTANYDVFVYTTEVLAYREAVEVNPEIPEEATKVRYSVWRDDKYALSKETAEKAPAGYESVVEYDWLGNTAKDGAAWGADQTNFLTFILDDTMKIAEYTDIYFAMKAENCQQIYVRGKTHYTAGGWLYVHYSQAADGTWSLSVKSADGTYAIENAQTGIVATTLKGLIEYGSTGGGCYPVRSSLDQEAIIYFTEVRAVAKPWEGPGISENAVEISSTAMYAYANTQLVPNTELGEVTAPAGFTKVSRMDAVDGGVGSNNILATSTFSNVSLLPYSEVWFALMVVNGRLTQTKPEWKDIDDNNTAVWVYFHLTQTEVGVWSIEIVKDGAVWNTITAQAGRDNTIGSLFDYDSDNGRIVLYQNSDLTQKLSVYSTEVVAVAREFTAFAPSIPDSTEELSASAFIPGYTSASEMAAPAGFSKVTEYTWNSGDFPITAKLNNTNLANYTDVYFAMKLVNGNGYYVQGCAMYYGEFWLYVSLHKEADGTWTKTLQSEDGYYAQQKGLTDNTIADMMQWKSGANRGSYPKSHLKGLGIDATAYFTEILAVEDVYDPQIAANAVTLTSPLTTVSTGNVTVIEDCSAIQKAAGFDKVYGISGGESWVSSSLPQKPNYNESVNLSLYSEVWFAYKLYNARFVFVNLGKNDLGAGADGTDWIYFHLTQNADATWTVEVTYQGEVYVTATNQVGATALALTFDGGYGSTDGGAFVLYQYSGTPCSVYTTEMKGVFKSGVKAEATQVIEHVYNTYYFGEDAGVVKDGAQAAPDAVWSNEAAPAGFSKVIEYSWTKIGEHDFGIGRLNTIDLSGYNELWFAMKLVGGSKIYIQGTGTWYEGDNWMYVHFYKAADGTWSKDFYTVDGYTLYGVQKGLTGNTLNDLMKWTSGLNVGSYPNKDDNATAMIYFTELLGIKPVSNER